MAGEVALRRFIVSSGGTSPGFQLVDQALDGVPLLVEADVVGDWPAPLRPLFFRLAAWSIFSGMPHPSPPPLARQRINVLFATRRDGTFYESKTRTVALAA
ncbi:hypothetical protein [Streptomyces sp. NPDC008121]|uniref:hypothetical protein n=1 Tax=Streptomyces sp. NPDC008121 TaxID=3364809 RepID=UPI0036EC4F94